MFVEGEGHILDFSKVRVDVRVNGRRLNKGSSQLATIVSHIGRSLPLRQRQTVF